MKRSSYSYHCRHTAKPRPERDRLRTKVVDIHRASRGAAGSRTIAAALQRQGEPVGRYQARSLMREAGVESKQPPSPRYKKAEKPSMVAENLLRREFRREQPNEVWCGDVTYVWTGKQWLGLLHPPRYRAHKPGVENRISRKRETQGCHLPFRSGLSLHQQVLSTTACALPDSTEHEPTGELLGQCAHGTLL